MYNNEKIGVAIITYNRQQKFKRLYDSLQKIDYIDNIIIIKHKNIDYHQNDPKFINNSKVLYKNILDNCGVGHNKNEAIKLLLQQNIDHIFIIQDDVLIKKEEVFKQYIDTAKKFNIQHLNFCSRLLNNIQQKPIFTLNINQNYGLDFYKNLCGMFEYFTKKCIEQVGLMNQRYINALQHVEHTYRICLHNMYIPKFHLFADIKNSFDYLEDTGNETTIQNKSEQYKQNLMNAFNLFKQTYGIQVNQLSLPNKNELINFYQLKQVTKTLDYSKPKIGLCCIACLEDNYIDEWIDYHLMLGFDQIFIYQNNWRAKLKKHYSNVHLIQFDGINKQRSAYKHCLINHSELDYIAFWDVDEFLYMKNLYDIHKFLKPYQQFFGIGMNWRCFGDNNLQKVQNNNYSVINRFTKCENKLNHNVKIILNVKLLKTILDINKIFFTSPHSINLPLITTTFQKLNGPWNEKLQGNYPAQIYHYILKTKQEYIQTKMKRGNGDNKIDNWYLDINKYWNEHNKNEIFNDNLINVCEYFKKK